MCGSPCDREEVRRPDQHLNRPDCWGAQQARRLKPGKAIKTPCPPSRSSGERRRHRVSSLPGGGATPRDLLGVERKMVGPVDAGEAQGPFRGPFPLIDSALHRQVREAATAAGINVAQWMRHMMRQIRRSDFPQSWRAGQAGRRHPTSQRSHDSRYYGKRFMMRLDAPARDRLEELVSHFDASYAEIICQLIVQAKLEDLPPSWHLAVGECRRRRRRRTP
jgi:hypothetical protein